jgi:GDPmannose 4,6-dehydratase
VLGDLEAVRDWSHAKDVVHAAWLALQHAEPGDYVVASGVGRTVGDLVDVAFREAGLEPGLHVRVDEGLLRSPEPIPLVGDPALARHVLGWRPQRSFEAMIAEMVAADLDALRSA